MPRTATVRPMLPPQGSLWSRSLLSGVVAGILVGTTEVIAALSLGTLIFSGPLAAFLPYGVGIALVSAMILLAGISLASRIPAVIASVQDSPAVVLAAMAAGIATALSAGQPETLLATVLVALAIATTVSGFTCLALGHFKLGRLVRFMPYPVIGGFLAGTGWLLVAGSFGAMSDYALTWRNVPALLEPQQLILWAPGLAIALLLFFGLRRIRHFWALPALLAGSLALFYLTLGTSGISLEAATRQGLLLGAMGQGTISHPLAAGQLLAVDWPAIVAQAGNIAIVAVLSVVNLLLYASALELVVGRDIDLNHELKAAGLAGIASGLAGGLVGYQALSLTTLANRMGARGRLPGLVAAAVCAAVLLAGSSLLAYLPKAMLGGLLFFLGLDFLVEWLVRGWKRLSRIDYAVVVLILAVIALAGLLVGVAVGLLVMVVLFVLDYSRMGAVRLALSGSQRRSNVERCAYHRQVLADDLGKRIFILELQGFIFFGTATAVLDKIQARLTDKDLPGVRYMILDFQRVTGLDSSGVLSFVKGRQAASARNCTLVLTHLTAAMQRRFSLDGITDGAGGVRIFPDLDRGLEWCEDQLLDSEGITFIHVPITLSAQLADSGFEKKQTIRLLNYLERVDFEQDDRLVVQGDEADKLYFIERGTVSVRLELDNGECVRLQTLGLGTAVGEPGMYLGTKCSASVVADSPGIAYCLTQQGLALMEQEDPVLAASFHRLVARLLSERLVATTRTLEAVLK